MQTQAGDVFNRDRIQADLQRVFGLGLFEDINLSVEPGTDPRKAVVVINAIEGSFGSVAAGGGFSSVGASLGPRVIKNRTLAVITKFSGQKCNWEHGGCFSMSTLPTLGLAVTPSVRL